MHGATEGAAGSESSAYEGIFVTGSLRLELRDGTEDLNSPVAVWYRGRCGGAPLASVAVAATLLGGTLFYHRGAAVLALPPQPLPAEMPGGDSGAAGTFVPTQGSAALEQLLALRECCEVLRRELPLPPVVSQVRLPGSGRSATALAFGVPASRIVSMSHGEFAARLREQDVVRITAPASGSTGKSLVARDVAADVTMTRIPSNDWCDWRLPPLRATLLAPCDVCHVFAYGTLRPDDKSGASWTYPFNRDMHGRRGRVRGMRLFHARYPFVTPSVLVPPALGAGDEHADFVVGVALRCRNPAMWREKLAVADVIEGYPGLYWRSVVDVELEGGGERETVPALIYFRPLGEVADAITAVSVRSGADARASDDDDLCEAIRPILCGDFCAWQQQQQQQQLAH